MSVLSAGHLCTDTAQGAVPALLPFLVSERGYSYTQLSALVVAATVASSVIQPLFGHYSDRRSLPWLMPAGVLLAGSGIAVVGMVSSYWLTFAAIVLSGVGVAAFHPEAARFANYVSGARRASGMSFFAVGGNAGFALGPVIVTPAVLAFGLEGTLVAALLPAAMAIVLARELSRLVRFRPPARARGAPADERPHAWGAFAVLGGAVACRSFIHFGLVTFAPLYYIAHLRATEAEANTALTLMLLAGAGGTLVGGRLADRVGLRTVLIGSFAAVTPFVLGFVAAGPFLATVLLMLAGAATITTFSLTVVLGQQYLPARIGVASGVMLGLAIGLGGVGALVLGVVADRFGLVTLMYVIAALPLVAAALSVRLPAPSPGGPIAPGTAPGGRDSLEAAGSAPR